MRVCVCVCVCAGSRVVGGVDEVVGQGLGHVLVHCLVLQVDGRVFLTTQETEGGGNSV